MTSLFRRHMSYANVAATMALVFAMSGSALAADHLVFSASNSRPKEFGYTITSITQISPRVQAELEAAGRLQATEQVGPAGPAGATGATGATGAQGPAGTSGETGAQGTTGAQGVAGPQGVEGPQGREGGRGEQGAPGERGEPGEPGLSVLTQSEQETLKSLLPYIKFEDKGIDSKPTIEISGANVQIVDGTGSETAATNGEGNLIVGYQEGPASRTGSNNLIVGPNDEYTAYGEIVTGENNRALAPFNVVFGQQNTATKEGATVTGGGENTADGEWAAILGGKKANLSTAYGLSP
jgi:hypothetical protein